MTQSNKEGILKKAQLSDSDSSDEEFIPSPTLSQTEEKDSASDALKKLRQKRQERKVDKIWEEMQHTQKKKKTDHQQSLKKVVKQTQNSAKTDSIDLAKKAIEKLRGKSDQKLKKTVKFAGECKEYEITNKRETIKKQKEEKEKLSGGMGVVDNILQQIDQSKRTQSSTIQKSKLDWQAFSSSNKLEEHFEKNRKGGGTLDKYLFKK